MMHRLKSMSFRNLALPSCIKDTHRENTPSNKTAALTKSMNVHIWAIGILNQLFI